MELYEHDVNRKAVELLLATGAVATALLGRRGVQDHEAEVQDHEAEDKPAADRKAVGLLLAPGAVATVLLGRRCERPVREAIARP